jgi:hypothetical protein
MSSNELALSAQGGFPGAEQDSSEFNQVVPWSAEKQRR